MANEQRLVRLDKAATNYDVSIKHLRRKIADGSLPAYRSGRMIRVRPEDLDALFRPIPSAAIR